MITKKIQKAFDEQIKKLKIEEGAFKRGRKAGFMEAEEMIKSGTEFENLSPSTYVDWKKKQLNKWKIKEMADIGLDVTNVTIEDWEEFDANRNNLAFYLSLIK